MGGRALKSIETTRCSRDEFDIISKELISILNLSFSRVDFPLFYRNKESFGDIDIIINTDGFNKNLREYIEETFKPNEIFHNDNCWSFDYKRIQIDLITTSEENFDALYNYMSFNDLGNLIGRIAQGFGLKYGQSGLWYEHYFKGINIGRIQISKNVDHILTFLGFDPEAFQVGFDNLEDIFEFVAESKYFNWERYGLATLTKINRERNLKRKSYMSFLEWIDQNVADDNHKFTFDKTQEEYNKIINKEFPEADLELNIRRLEYEYTRKLYIKAKFNGGDLISRYNIEGKELGNVINYFKSYIHIEKGNVDDYFLNTDKEEIYKEFDIFFNSIPFSD